jgi:hypothetical protein
VVGILLVNPKFPHNVGGALRAAACFGADSMWWTGERVPAPESWPEGARLPREERMRIRETVTWGVLGSADDVSDLTPVCVERASETESLIDLRAPGESPLRLRARGRAVCRRAGGQPPTAS